MTFATPTLLLLLPIALMPLAWGWLRTRRRPSMAVADLGAVREATQPQAGWRVRLRFVPDLLRAVAVIALVIALARPREGLATALIPEEGIDIVVTLDASTSMEFAASGGVSRIEAAREVVEEFVGTLEGDRIGLVIFQSRSLAFSPLTLGITAGWYRDRTGTRGSAQLTTQLGGEEPSDRAADRWAEQQRRYLPH